MGDKVKISSLEELAIFVYEHINDEKAPEFSIEGKIVSRLHVYGDSWDYRADKRTAKYLLSIQAVADEIIEEYCGLERKSILIKTEIKNGCHLPEVDWTNLLLALVNKMENWQAFTLGVMSLLGAAGYFWFSRYLNYKEHDANNENLKNALNCISKMSEDKVNNSCEKPTKILISSLEENDKISFNNDPEKIPAPEIKKYAPPRAPRSEETTTYADGVYTVLGRHYENEEILLELKQNGVHVDAHLDMLDNNDRQAFWDEINRMESEGAFPMTMDLQINVVHTSKKIKGVFLIAQGSPRENKTIKTLDSVLEK